jgi:phosphate:Na+ symporter
MIANLKADYRSIDILKAQSIESEINDARNKIRKKHLKSLENNDYPASSGLVFSNVFTYLERIGDHIVNVSEAASGINLE